MNKLVHNLILLNMALASLYTCCAAFSSPLQTNQQNTSNQESLPQFLQQHQLYRLYSTLLENRLAETEDGDQRNEIVTELAGLYAWEINTFPTRFETLSERLDQLATDYPQSFPLQTRINIAYGRYRQAKDLFEDWVWQRHNLDQRQQVDEQFQNVFKRCQQSIEQLDRQRTDLAATASSDAELAQMRRPFDTAIDQLNYLAAWAVYYRSLTLDDPQVKTELLTAAEQTFLKLLEVADGEVLQELSPRWFPLGSEWTSRLLLGMAMTSQALEKSEQANYCFGLLNQTRVPLAIRNSNRVWRFHAQIFANHFDHAANLASQMETNPEAANDIPFWSAVAVAGMSSKSTDDISLQMTKLGITKLAAANEFVLIDDLIATYPGQSVVGNRFFAKWLNGYLLLKQAEQNKVIEPAVNELRLALETASSAEPVYRARCRYHYGFALYLAAEFNEAAEQFRQSSAVLEQLDRHLAEHAKWMQCQSMNRMVGEDRIWRNSLVYALTEFQSKFPDSNFAAEAAFLQIMNDLDNVSTEQAITTLDAIQESDPNYLRALFENCRLSHQQWTASSAPDKLLIGQKTVEKANQFITAVQLREDRRPVRRVAVRYAKICMLATDIQLNQQMLDDAQIWFSRCDSLKEFIDGDRQLGSDYYFLALNLANQKGDDELARQATNWLLKNSTQPAYFRTALQTEATLLDRQLQALDGPLDQTTVNRAIDSYRRVFDEYNQEQTPLHLNEIARSALQRMAELQFDAKLHREAETSYHELVQAMPNELSFLLGLARSRMQLKKWTEAAELWNKIAKGVPVGHDNWLEAKYNLVICLTESGSDRASTILDQANLLVPEMPDPWATRFQELAAEMQL